MDKYYFLLFQYANIIIQMLKPNFFANKLSTNRKYLSLNIFYNLNSATYEYDFNNNKNIFFVHKK